jgi:hypothetical protein
MHRVKKAGNKYHQKAVVNWFVAPGTIPEIQMINYDAGAD